MVSNATVPILGAVDTYVVGQIPQAEPIAAVAVGAIVLTAVYWIFGFLRMGTAGMTAQALGAGDAHEVRALLMRALLIGGAAGAGFILLQGAVMAGAFALSPAAPEVENLARSYIAIRVWSAPAAIALYGITGWLIAQERTWAVLAIQLWMNGLNILLNFVFVLGFGWGVEGVAIASLIAEWTGLALGLWFCRDVFGAPGWADPGRLFDRARLQAMALVNSDIMIRSVLLQFAFTSFVVYYSAGMDTVTLAANQILLQFLYITAYALDGFAFAAEAIVGRAFGAHQVARLRRGVILCGIWSAGMVVLLSRAFAAGGGTLIEAMTKAPEVQAEAQRYLPWMVAAPLLGGLSWFLDGVFIGATRTRDMRNMMIVSFAVYLVAVEGFASFGNHGLWAALILFFVARGLTLAVRYPALERAARG